MAYTPAQGKAIQKYMKENLEDIRFRVKKGRKSEIRAHAEQQGESMTAFIIRAIDETMRRDILDSQYSSLFHNSG